MSQPVRQETVISAGGTEVVVPYSPAKIALYTVGGSVGIGLLAFVAAAVLKIAIQGVTAVALLVMVLAVVTLLPALMMALNAGRVRAKEGVARAMPLETLILQRKQFETLMQNKSRQLAEANAHLQDFKRLIDTNRKDMDPADVEAWEADLNASREAFARAQTHLEDLRVDLAEYDRQINKARIDMQLAQAKGNVAGALRQADLSAEDRHVTESALSEIARRVGRSAALLDEALNSGDQQSRRRNARGGRA
ncbi:hypothetical protein WDJ50_16690 [Deinococcus sp. VB142]|uniref:Uncharacterized protein n=1 Tax=Deinococcus sp. VB142 TaxID=3112952 RepID=A0AAU6Q766_9DEIO